MTFKNDINSDGLLLVSPFVLYINKRIRLTPDRSYVTVMKYTDDTCIIGCITNQLNQIEIIKFIAPRPSNEGHWTQGMMCFRPTSTVLSEKMRNEAVLEHGKLYSINSLSKMWMVKLFAFSSSKSLSKSCIKFYCLTCLLLLFNYF